MRLLNAQCRTTPRSTTLHRARKATLWTLGALALTVFSTTGRVEARGFLPTLDLIDPAAHVITTDGQNLYGDIPGTLQRHRGISRITFRTEYGEKLKLRAEDVQQVIIPVGPGTEVDLYAEVLTTVEKAIRADYELIHNVRAIVFDSLVWPDSDRRLLLQRVNPGFDQNIQVYGILNAKEGISNFDGVPWFGDEEKSYLAVKDLGEPMRIKKRHYRQDFERLFGDCEEFVDGVPKKQRKFRHFADHVYAYQQTCR